MPLGHGASEARVYEFAPGLRLRITGDRAAAAYFDAEYGSASTGSGAACVEVAFGAPVAEERARIDGTYRTVGWSVSLGDGSRTPLEAGIVLRGRPRRFALSLVQGYVVEQLLAVASARGGLVLLPGAALVQPDGALLVLGRSRSGKSSVTAWALARGVAVLGDDQVLVDAKATCLAFPRRLRAYGDLRRTAPAAYQILPRSTRAAVAARRFAGALTRGRVAPPVHVPASALGQNEPPPPTRVARVALVERARGLDEVRTDEPSADEVVAFAATLLAEQRVHLRTREASWVEASETTARLEQRVLRAALQDVPARRIALPDSWPAERAVAALAYTLGAEI